MVNKKQVYGDIRDYLITHADEIQRNATAQHKKFIGGNKFRSENIQKYQDIHNEIVKQIAIHLDDEANEGLTILKKLGRTLARESIKDNLHIEEAVDGVIYLKQSLGKSMKDAHLLNLLNINDYYLMNRKIGIYVDTVSSIIAFSYHNFYQQRASKYLAEKKRLEKRKDEFMGVVSHELKTPVASIKAFTQILQHKFARHGDEKSAILLGKMDAQINKLSSLINDLLDVTKIESGKLILQEHFFYFDELVDEIIEEVQRTTNRHKIHKNGSTGKTIFGDRDRIGQVLTNMLTNAIKYSPSSDRILVHLHADKEEVALCVQDFGIGISEENQSHIFERFYRIDGPRNKTIPGIGLGMYISHQIISRQRGKIWLESKEGKGSTFCFKLPVGERKSGLQRGFAGRRVNV